jgi:arabinofuranosyltransferase
MVNDTLSELNAQIVLSKRIASTLLCIALALFGIHTWLHKSFGVDDSFITFRFVQQWAAGNGIVYNIGEYVEGYSNFLWLVLLLPFEKVGFNLQLVAKTLGFLCGGATLILCANYAKSAHAPVIAPLLLAASAPFVA